MKLALFFAVISVLALSQASVLREPSTSDNLDEVSVHQGSIQPRATLIHGSIQPGDKRLYRLYLQQQAMPNDVQTQTTTVSGKVIISYVSATEVGHTQYANASVVAGGAGHNFVAIQAQSIRSWGFHFYVEVWGREIVA